MAITVETDRGRIGPLLAHSCTHLVGAPIRILVNAEERKNACGKIGLRKSGFILQLG